jgi:hypothetical protein
MNEIELLAKIEELLAIAKESNARSVALEKQVKQLQTDVARLNERLTYRERILVGWKEIGKHVDLSPDHARIQSGLDFDPLPVRKEGANVVARATALDAWKERRIDYRRPKLVPRESTEDPS